MGLERKPLKSIHSVLFSLDINQNLFCLRKANLNLNASKETIVNSLTIANKLKIRRIDFVYDYRKAIGN